MVTGISQSCCEMFYFRVATMNYSKVELESILLDDALDSGNPEEMMEALQEFKSTNIYRPELTQNTFEFLMSSSVKDDLIEMYNLPEIEVETDDESGETPESEEPPPVALKKREKLGIFKNIAKQLYIVILKAKKMVGARKLHSESSDQVVDVLIKGKLAETREKNCAEKDSLMKGENLSRSLIQKFERLSDQLAK